jgi:hypothetical protein
MRKGQQIASLKYLDVSLRVALALALLTLGLLGCNSGSDSGSDGSDKLTAKIDGKGFSASAISISAQVNFGVPGAIFFVGSQTTDNLTRSITVTVYNVYGPAEYPLGVNSEVFGGTGQTGEGTGTGGKGISWITADNGRAGKLILKSIGQGRMTGTFEYVSEPGVNNTIGEKRTITEGQFDIAYKGVYVPASEGKGSRMHAMLNNKPYTAANASGSLLDFTGKAGIQITTLNEETGISLVLEGVTAPGTFTLSSMSPGVRSISAGRNGGTAEFCCWQSANVGSTGTITITEITATRIKGSFSATLKPTSGKAATADIVIENGLFDVAVGL